MLQPFLRRSLLARGTGFHFTEPPPSDIADHRYLEDADDSLAVGCALANLQQGRFDVSRAPINRMLSSDNHDLPQMAMLLFGHSAPRGEIRMFLDWIMRRDDSKRYRYRAGEAAVAAGGLWAVPALLETYVTTERREVRGNIQYALSWLLEEEPGPIDEGPDKVAGDDSQPSFGEEPESRPDTEGYVALVKATEQALRRDHGFDDDSVVVQGRLLDVDTLARKLLQHIHGNPSVDLARVNKGSLLLEAMTGWKFTGFYNEQGAFQPLQAAAAVEEFLDAKEARHFEPGLRYFFGHRIPE